MRISACSKFFAAAVPEHAHQRVVDFDEAAVRGGEKHSFLNVVEQFAIAALRFPAVGDVLEHVDGLQAFAVGAVYPRSGDKVSAVEHREHIFVGSGVVLGERQKGQECDGRFIVHHHQGAHVDADEFLGLNSDEIGQRTVYPQNVVRLVVRHNEIGDGIEDLDPVPVGLVHAGKQPGIFQSDGGVRRDGLQQLLVAALQRLSPICQAQHAHQFSRRTLQPDQAAILPAQRGTDISRRTDRLRCQTPPLLRCGPGYW